MASHNQPSVRDIPHFCIHTTTTPTNNTHSSIQALPERFRALNRLQPTNSNTNSYSKSNNNKIYKYYSQNKSNKLYNKYFASYRQAFQHTLHATVLTLLALLFSDWITQASVAAAVPTQQRRYELPTKNLPKRTEHAPPLEPLESLLSIALAEEDDFNSSSYLTASIQSASGLVSVTAVAGATAAANTNGSAILSVGENSISPQYVAGNTGGGGGTSGVKGVKGVSGGVSGVSGGVSGGVSASAALITTSSIWDPIVGAYPTDISIAPAPPPQPPTPTQVEQGLNEVDEQFDDFALPPWHAAIVCIILMLIIIGTVIGNVLVCIAVCMVRKLRRPCNYLLVSLALSDLCVALLVMPMAMLYEVLDKWNFGPILCDIWVSFDVLCCTASILNLCAISVDRYLAITKPLEYGVKRTPRRMMACVALVWLAAASISLPPLLILGNEHVDEHGTPICIVCQNFAYQIYATLGSFYIPLSVMLFVYYQIFRAARRIVLEEKRAQTHLQHALNGTSAQQPQPLLQPATQLPGNTDLTVFGASGNGGGGGGGGGNGQQCRSSYGNTSLTYSTCGTLSAHHASGGSGGGVSGSSGLLGSPHQKKLRFQLAKEKKASTTLGIIMSAFTICWLPFFILALIRPFVESETVHVPHSLSSLFLWLGYANSLLNPIIYATLNRDFRKPFQLILHLRCSSLNTMMRENYYQDQYGEPPSQRVMLGDERHGARESFL